MSDEFTIKDSGQRIDYASGMRRDVNDDKPDFLLLRDGPMFKRLAEHLTKGAAKYGKRNWQRANSDEEYQRFRESAARHFEQWLAGDRDEDHAAAVMFNVNAAEYVRGRIEATAARDFGAAILRAAREGEENLRKTGEALSQMTADPTAEAEAAFDQFEAERHQARTEADLPCCCILCRVGGDVLDLVEAEPEQPKQRHSCPGCTPDNCVGCGDPTVWGDA